MGQTNTQRRLALIVEDDVDLRALIVALFEDSDLEIVECESAEAALAIMLMRGPEGMDHTPGCLAVVFNAG